MRAHEAHPCRKRKVGLLLALAALAGCAASPAPRTWLDPHTAATITAQGAPTVLARDEQMRAINVRDYAQLGAIEVNRMGERAMYLVVVLWSTIDRSAAEREQLLASLARVDIQADDRTIGLSALQDSAREAGVSPHPFVLPTPAAQEVFFPVTREELESMASSESLRLSAHGGAQPAHQYTLWRDGRESLAQLLSKLPAQR